MPLSPLQNLPQNLPKPKKKRKIKNKKGVGVKCTILLTALHSQAMVNKKHPTGFCTNKERLSDCLMMEQAKMKIKGEFKLCIVVKHEDYGDDLFYCTALFAVITSEGSENDYFAAEAPILTDLPVWRGDGTDNRNEINNDIYYAWNNADKDVTYVRTEGFLVDNDTNPAPENISNAVPVAGKDNRLPLDQEWRWDNTCNRQKDGNHHKNAKVNNHTKQDLIDLGFLQVFWLMFPKTYFYLFIVNYKSHTLLAEGHQKNNDRRAHLFSRLYFFHGMYKVL